MMKKTFLFIVVFTLTLFACSDQQSAEQTLGSSKVGQSAAEPSKQIIASFYPLAFITEQIVGDKIQVVNMAGSVDVHAYEPTPQDLVKLNKASLVVFQGAELEPWTDGIIPELKAKGVATLEVSHDLALVEMDAHEEHENHEDEHTEHEDKKHEREEAHDEHHHGEFDPHTWLDPVLAQEMADAILAAVVAIDPANEASYQTNAKVLKDRLASLDQSYQAGLAQCENQKMIISHDAYGYLARRYGFQFHAITGFSPQDEPSAKILAELKDEAEEGITHLLIEENKVRRFADTLARETGLKTLPVNPLGRGTLDSKKDFFDVMQDNLSSFKAALNCQ